MKHKPTGIGVKCSEQRTQGENKRIALEMLKAKLVVVAQEQQAAEIANIRGDIVKVCQCRARANTHTRTLVLLVVHNVHHDM